MVIALTTIIRRDRELIKELKVALNCDACNCPNDERLKEKEA